MKFTMGWTWSCTISKMGYVHFIEVDTLSAAPKQWTICYTQKKK